MSGKFDSVGDGLTENTHGYVCSNCGEEWDYRNFTITGSINVSELDIERICPSIDQGFVIHVD